MHILQTQGQRKNNGSYLCLASPDMIRSWSCGEVQVSGPFNDSTSITEKDGLFSANLFGPIKDYECSCGKYQSSIHKDIVCDKCGVEITSRAVRNERMGHIELATPLLNTWYLRSFPTVVSTLLKISIRDIERLVYRELCLVAIPGERKYKLRERLSEDIDYYYSRAIKKQDNMVEIRSGAEAIQELLVRINSGKDFEIIGGEKLSLENKQQCDYKRLKLIESFLKMECKPEWMILTALPILPPNLRPINPLKENEFSVSDVNYLYSRVINRNNRFKYLLAMDKFSIVVNCEKRLLQEAVNALMDNCGSPGRPLFHPEKDQQPLESIADLITDKLDQLENNSMGNSMAYLATSVSRELQSLAIDITFNNH